MAYENDITSPAQNNDSFPFAVSAQVGSTSAYCAFDHLTDADAWHMYARNATSCWIQIDFGVGNGKKVTSYAITGDLRVPYVTNSPKAWTLQGSNDNSNWTTLDTVANQTAWSAAERRVFTVATPGYYRYYKLVVSDNNGSEWTAVGEIEMMVTAPDHAFDLTTPAQSNDSSPLVTSCISGSATNAFCAFDHFVDNNSAHQWSINATSGWIQVDFGAGKKKRVTSYAVTGDVRAAYVANSPKAWTLQGSNDGANFNTVDSQSNQAGWAGAERREFICSTPGAYRYYRLNVTDNNGSAWLSVGELELMASPPTASFVPKITLF